MALKSIQRSATVAFAPMAQVMAVGTMAGAIDPSFSSSANLELLKVDFASTDMDMPVLSSIGVPERFNRLSWSNVAAGSPEEFPLGVIAGGLADGSLHFWNPQKLLSGDLADREIAAVYKNSEAHNGNVWGLEFSPLTPNILASGGEDGALLVWDLTTPSAASTFPPLKGAIQGESPGISYVSWNRKVQHIVASTSYSGTSVVWDLRRAKPVISFTDPTSRRRCSTLQWNPDVATQLIVASDDDRSPSLQVWDLRNSASPIKELVGHTKGVLAMAWCPCDSSFLLTCSKDNQTLCWDTASGESLCEVPPGNNWNFDVQWSPGTPGVLSTSSYDGKINIYNIEACSRTSSSHDSYFGGAVGRQEYSTALRKAPKWVGRRNPVTFGFGGTLISLALKKHTPGTTAVLTDFRIQNLLTEEGLVKRSIEFEEAIAGGKSSALRNFCKSKACAAISEEDAETWSILKIMFDEEARKQLLAYFGFSALDLEKPEEQEENPVCVELANLGLTESSASVEEAKPAAVFSVDDDNLEGSDDGENFFDRLETPMASTEPIVSSLTTDDLGESAKANTEAATIDPVSEMTEDEGDNETDEAIRRALVAGDFKGAVDICLGAGRVADALVMAAVGGSGLWKKTQQEYFRRTKRPYLKVVSAVVNNDLQGLVESRPLEVWKETLALICTYARSEDWINLCDALGARLDAGHNIQAATLCYICAGNIERTVLIWSRTLKSKKGGPEFTDVLQDIMERSVILGLATGMKQASTSLARLVCYYAELLANQGLLSTALEYIKLVPSDDSFPELSAVRERISHSYQVAATNSNLPSYSEKSYFSDQRLPGSAPMSNQQYNPPVQQQSYYPPDSYHHESTSSPSYASNLPPLQPMESLFPNQPLPSIRFMPVSPPLQQQVAAQEPRSPHAAGNTSAPSSAPPATVQTADTSNVAAELKPVVLTLTRIFDETSAYLGGTKAPPAKKREIEDNSRKLGALFIKLNSADLSANVSTKLIQLCQATNAGDYATAMQIQVALTTSDWDECGFWLTALKRMIKLRQTMR